MCCFVLLPPVTVDFRNHPDCKVHGAHLGPTGPRWAPCWPHELCYLGIWPIMSSHLVFNISNALHFISLVTQRMMFRIISYLVLYTRLFVKFSFYPRPVLAFGYCRCLRLCVCVSVCLSVCQSLVCPCNNLGPVQARIAKFGPKMQKTLVKVPIVFGGQLTSTFKVKFNLKVWIYRILSLSGQ